MAEVSVPALAVITPAAQQRNNAPQSSPKESEQAQQPSFAQVLKSRSQNAEQSAARNAPADSGKASASRDKAAPDENSAPLADAQGNILPWQDPALLLGAQQSESDALAPEANPDADAMLGKGPNENAALLPDPSAAAAALAAAAASLAGKAAAAGEQNADPSGQGPAGTAQSAVLSLSERPLRSPGETNQDLATASQAQAAAGELKARPSGAETQTSFSAELNIAQQHAAHTGALQTATRGQELPRHEISSPVASRNWADEVGQKLQWVAGRDNGRAELVLNPPQMGRVEVSIDMNGDQASATFAAANPLAREALQDALPRLREVLAQAGIQLGQANVNAGNSGQAQGEAQTGRSPYAGNRYGNSDAAALEPLVAANHASWSRSGSGMIDTFA